MKTFVVIVVALWIILSAFSSMKKQADEKKRAQAECEQQKDSES